MGLVVVLMPRHLRRSDNWEGFRLTAFPHPSLVQTCPRESDFSEALSATLGDRAPIDHVTRRSCSSSIASLIPLNALAHRRIGDT